MKDVSKRLLRRVWLSAGTGAVISLAGVWAVGVVSSVGANGLPAAPAVASGPAGTAGAPVPLDAGQPADEKALRKDLGRLESKFRSVSSRIASLQPRGIWVLVDAGANRISLMKNEQVLREAPCSTGKGTRLEDPETGRKWIFNTPRGEFRVRRKKTDPVWTKPDWAFIEEGEPIPRSYRDRVEEGVLGDYALDLGDGYLIHGTLYKRTLGMSVSHGCVRVGDDDLKVIYQSVTIGTRVFII